MSEESNIPSRDDNEFAYQQVLSSFGGPAYVRRARAVEEELNRICAHCQQQRQEYLNMVTLRVGTLKAMAGDWDQLIPFFHNPQQLEELKLLHEELSPKLMLPVPQVHSNEMLYSALAVYCESAARFNKRWKTFIQEIDLSNLNELREAYNRFYVLEKECATRSFSAARRGFTPLEMMTTDELLERFPYLVVPEIQRIEK